MSEETNYCCTCGISTTGQSSGSNPTTMCKNCTSEDANFCCICRKDLRSQNGTLVICLLCLKRIKNKE